MWVERKPGRQAGWNPPTPDEVPDILGNFLKPQEGRLAPWRGQSTRSFGHAQGHPPSELFIVTKCRSTQGRIFKDSLDEWELLVAPCFLKCVMAGI